MALKEALQNKVLTVLYSCISRLSQDEGLQLGSAPLMYPRSLNKPVSSRRQNEQLVVGAYVSDRQPAPTIPRLKWHLRAVPLT